MSSFHHSKISVDGSTDDNIFAKRQPITHEEHFTLDLADLGTADQNRDSEVVITDNILNTRATPRDDFFNNTNFDKNLNQHRTTMMNKTSKSTNLDIINLNDEIEYYLTIVFAFDKADDNHKNINLRDLFQKENMTMTPIFQKDTSCK